MNIVIDGHSLAVLGGVERFVCDLANALLSRGHTVFLFINDALPTPPQYPLAKAVQTVIYTHQGRQRCLEAFRQQILACNPDVCISPASDRQHLPWCHALCDTGIPLVISEHSNPDYLVKNLWNEDERLAVMEAADGIHLLLPYMAQSLPQVLRQKVCIIPNASNLPILERIPRTNKTIVSLGRLHWEKQNDLLIKAFALLREDFADWRLEIWGEGPDTNRLESLVNKNGLADRVTLCGRTNTPEQCYAYADIVCVPSRCEAYGLTVIEALAAGIPCVGFADCPGVNQLILDGVNGLLASIMDYGCLANTLAKLMSNADMRQQMGLQARQTSLKFAPEAVYDQWENFLTQIASLRGKTNLLRLADLDAAGVGWAKCLDRCLQRKNLYVDDGQWLRRLVFAMPWLKRILRPWYQTYKNLVRKI